MQGAALLANAPLAGVQCGGHQFFAWDFEEIYEGVVVRECLK